MFSDLDESLRELLIADVPIERTQVDIEFDRPSREWSSRLSRPTLNLFLYDIREREALRDDFPFAEALPGQVTRRRPPRRIDCSYLITAWAKEAADEHRILAHVLAAMYRHAKLPEEQLQGDLQGLDYDVLLRVATPEHLAKPSDFWGVMDNELHACLVWVATIPLDAFRPFTTPIVTTATFAVGARGEAWREPFVTVAGAVRPAGDPQGAAAGVRLAVLGTALDVTTGDDGRFVLARILPGDYTMRIEAPDSEPRELPLTVPSESYDIQL